MLELPLNFGGGGPLPNIRGLEAGLKVGERIDSDQAMWLWRHADDADLQKLASIVKERRHPADRATYLKMGIVNFTNICVAGCDYCAFYKYPHEAGTYQLTEDQIMSTVQRLADTGATMIGFNAGFNPKLRLGDYATLFQKIRARFSDMIFYELTVAEFMFYCKLEKISYADGAEMMREHGTQWITGGGAEVLSEGFRKRHSPGKYTVADYFECQRILGQVGINSTATMVIGFDETIEERFDHLRYLREFQDNAARKLPSFLCWTYKPFNNKLGGAEIDTGEYLRWLAICRIYLDNIPHIRTSVLTKNEQALVGLRYGADDFDLPIEDSVTELAGATVSQNFDQVLQTGRDLGFELSYRQGLSVSVP